MKKRRQHHVWQRYLKSWAVNNQLYCLSDNHIFCTNTSNVAVERDFYKLYKVNSEDLNFIKMLAVEQSNQFTKKAHEEFLTLVTEPMRFVENNIEKLHYDGDADELTDAYRTNVLEDYLSGIEDSFLPLLDLILNQNIGFYSNDESCVVFLQFICTNYMRTKGFKDTFTKEMKKKTKLNVETIWSILIHLLASNVGLHLYAERKKRKLVLVNNCTDVTFITGDQPIINLHAVKSQIPSRLAFYYPISPRLALILGEQDEEPPYSTERITSAQVSELNAKILEACHSQVFGQSEDSLLGFLERALKLR